MCGGIVFPFTRVVGQEEMKKALLLNIVDPAIGGVLIRGEKGIARSTIMRSMSMRCLISKLRVMQQFHLKGIL